MRHCAKIMSKTVCRSANTLQYWRSQRLWTRSARPPGWPVTKTVLWRKSLICSLASILAYRAKAQTCHPVKSAYSSEIITDLSYAGFSSTHLNKLLNLLAILSPRRAFLQTDAPWNNPALPLTKQAWRQFSDRVTQGDFDHTPPNTRQKMPPYPEKPDRFCRPHLKS